MLVNKSNYLGKQVGSYHIVACLGSGGFADVYLGEHIYLKTQSAIKMLHIQLSKRALQNFLNEAKIIARLEHPNIIHVFDYGVQDGSPFLVMNYAPNGNLRQRYPRGTRLPLEQITPYIQQAASALDYAHELNLIHRDVKPANMLLGQQQQLLLSDFGLALAISGSDVESDISSADSGSDSQPKVNIIISSSDSASDISSADSNSDSQPKIDTNISSSDSQPKIHSAISHSELEQSMSMADSNSDPQPKISTAGTIPYMAPEQLLGKACYASDQYALAIITYEWICGEYPFTGSFMKIASQHVLATPPSLNARVPNLPSGVEQVILKALAKDPTQRFATVSDFAQALQHACHTVSSTSILKNENAITAFERETASKASSNTPDKKSQLAISTEQNALDSASENDISRNSDIQYNAAKIATPSQSALDMFDPSSDNDTTYSTLKLPAQADITYSTSKLPIHSNITLNTSTTPPNPPSSTTLGIPIFPNGSHKRRLRFALLSVVIIALVISGIILGLTWHSNTHATSIKEPPQRQSLVLHKSTQQANHTTQQGVPAGTTTTTPIATLPTNIVNTSTTPATNPQPVLSTPGATSPAIPTPTATPTPDCIQASLTNISFMSPPNPVIARTRKLTLTNCGGSGSTNWQAAVQSSGWLNVNLAMGSIAPGASRIILVQTDVDGLPAGDYNGTIVFTAGTSSWTITVEYTIK